MRLWIIAFYSWIVYYLFTTKRPSSFLFKKTENLDWAEIRQNFIGEIKASFLISLKALQVSDRAKQARWNSVWVPRAFMNRHEKFYLKILMNNCDMITSLNYFTSRLVLGRPKFSDWNFNTKTKNFHFLFFYFWRKTKENITIF